MRPACLVVVCLLALPAAARAALPFGEGPRDPALAQLGLRVSWPVDPENFGTTSVLTGRELAVRLTPSRTHPQARSATPRISLIRVDGNGRPMRVIARRSLRSGTFAVRIPPGAPARYELRLDVGARRFWSWLATEAHRWSSCAFTTPRSGVALTVEPSAARTDERLTVRYINAGNTCLEFGAEYAWERLAPDGSWEAVPQPPPGLPVPSILYRAGRGASGAIGAFVWPTMRPGPHRLVKAFRGEEAVVTATAPFEVLP